MTHDQLAEDLAAHLRGYSTPMVVWTDMQLGPAGSARPDVYAIEKTYTALRARVFEVKVSRSDFLADVTSGKYLRYAAFAGSITFATPAGLVSKEEVPKGCGLITRSPDGVWRYQRKPTLQPTPDLPVHAWLKLVIDGCARERDVRQAEKCSPRTTTEWCHQRRVRERFGAELAAIVADRDNAVRALQAQAEEARRERQDRVDHQRAQIAKERQELEQMLAEAARALGLEEGASVWCIRRELDERLKGDPAARIAEALRSIGHAEGILGRCRGELQRLVPADACGLRRAG